MILASRQNEERGTQEAAGPPLSSYSPTVERLDALIDAVNANTTATIAAAGAKKIPRLRPQARPSTAYETVKYRRQLAGNKRLVSRFMRTKRVDSDQQRDDSGG